MNTTPISLLQRLRQPDAPVAWPRFVQLYSPLLLFWARKAGLQEQDAADLVQDVFLVLVRKLPEFDYDTHRSFRSWLRTITLNKWRDRIRRLAVQPGRAGIDPDEVPAEEPDSLFAEGGYRRQLLARTMELVRPEMQPATWQAFLEHGMKGRPAADVARETGLTVGAVYAAKFRVLTRLRTELQGLLDE